MTGVSVVIPVRDDAARLRGCLQSLAVADSQTVDIIVIDNGSTDESAAVARSFGATVLELPGLSVSQMRNRAVAEARTPLIAMVDADHVLGPGWIRACRDAMADPGVAIAGAPCHAPRPGTWVQRAYDRFRTHPTTRGPLEWLGAGNMVIRRDVFLHVNGFDESLETCEDVDLCNRVRQAGGRIVAEPRMHNVHLGDPATLKALFLSELWRGRDNIRVTLRGPLTPRALPSLLTPVLVLTACAVAAASIMLLPSTRWAVISAGVSLTVIAAAIALRTARISRRGPWRLSAIAQNLAVAIVYELARALALLARASHATRRKADRG